MMMPKSSRPCVSQMLSSVVQFDLGTGQEIQRENHSLADFSCITREWAAKVGCRSLSKVTSVHIQTTLPVRVGMGTRL
jgi:hypothetical protein